MHLTHIPKVQRSLYFQHIIVAATIQRSAATLYIHVSDYQIISPQPPDDESLSAMCYYMYMYVYITCTDMLEIIADSDGILVTSAPI